jgi:hypothetical protein
VITITIGIVLIAERDLHGRPASQIREEHSARPRRTAHLDWLRAACLMTSAGAVNAHDEAAHWVTGAVLAELVASAWDYARSSPRVQFMKNCW